MTFPNEYFTLQVPSLFKTVTISVRKRKRSGLMKRFYSMLIPSLLLGFTLLLACSNFSNQPDLEPSEHDDIAVLEDFKSIALQDSITPTSATFVYDNRTDTTFTLGEAYSLEINLDDAWYQVPVILEDEYGFHDIGYESPPDEMIEMEINWEWLYGTLEPGEYRIVQEVLDVHEPGDYETYTIATEFEIE